MGKLQVLKLLKERDVRILTPAMIRKRLGVSGSHARNILPQLEKEGFLVRVKRGLYVNDFLDDLHPYELVPFLTEKEAYVSLFSILSDEGIIEDLPASVYVVTNSRGRKYKTPLGIFRFYRMADKHIWGYHNERFKYSVRPLAEPEKAFLDLVYLSSTPSRDLSLPGNWKEIVKELNHEKLKKYAKKFGSRVEKFISRIEF